jgi:hypothetical protein
MNICKSLKGVPKKEVVFDLDNPTHTAAVKSLMIEGRQHPTLRFVLEDQFPSVPIMILHKIALQYLKEKTGENYMLPGSNCKLHLCAG